jgi:hypothetical protein
VEFPPGDIAVDVTARARRPGPACACDGKPGRRKRRGRRGRRWRWRLGPCRRLKKGLGVRELYRPCWAWGEMTGPRQLHPALIPAALPAQSGTCTLRALHAAAGHGASTASPARPGRVQPTLVLTASGPDNGVGAGAVLVLVLVMELAASRAAGRAGRLRLCYVIARGGHSRPCSLLLAPTTLTPTQPHTAAHRRTQARTQTLPHTQEQTPPHTQTQTPPAAVHRRTGAC